MTTFNFEKRENMIKAYNGKPTYYMVNLTQHALTKEQYTHNNEELTVVTYKPYAKEVQNDILEFLTFNKIPSKEEILKRADLLAIIASNTIKQAEDLSEIPATEKYALIGGAPYLMGPLEEALRKQGIQPLYAFSQRESVEEVNSDGSVTKTTIFKHKGYIEA